MHKTASKPHPIPRHNNMLQLFNQSLKHRVNGRHHSPASPLVGLWWKQKRQSSEHRGKRWGTTESWGNTISGGERKGGLVLVDLSPLWGRGASGNGFPREQDTVEAKRCAKRHERANMTNERASENDTTTSRLLSKHTREEGLTMYEQHDYTCVFKFHLV